MTSKQRDRSEILAVEDDRDLVARARKGDPEAFRGLVERYQGRALRLAQRVLRDEDRARDAVQEAFLKVYRTLRRFEGRSSFYTWFYRLVLNVCLDMRRRDRPERQVEWTDGEALESQVQGSLSASLAGSAKPTETPDAALLRSELRERVGAAIGELPDGPRETLLLREVDGLSYAEIAEVLGIPKGTVMSRLHYARKRVQGVLREHGALLEGLVDLAPDASDAQEPKQGRGDQEA